MLFLWFYFQLLANKNVRLETQNDVKSLIQNNKQRCNDYNSHKELNTRVAWQRLKDQLISPYNIAENRFIPAGST